MLSAVGFAGAQPVAAASGRTVEIRWDFRESPSSGLQIWVDCRRAGDEGISSCTKGSRVIAPEAYHFELRRGDRVTLLAIDVKSDDEGDPEYVITGTNLDEKDPTIGLTVEDIPTRSRYHKRLALVFSIDF